MTSETMDFVLIEDAAALQQFINENKEISWLSFDTEFVGEKRYVTLICLIQVGTDNGFYLIDPLKVKDLSDFFKMLEDPSILKITHAGENDYRLLYREFGILPKNVFDTQVAAGFVGYKFPASFRSLVEGEAGVYLRKGYTVSNWESRPFNPKQLKYALDDVLYLKGLWENLSAKLEEAGRAEWVKEEFAKMEKKEHYEIDLYREALSSNMIQHLSQQDQAFLIRLYEWRRSTAERKNYSKEMVLSGKLIGPILKNINSGRAALKNHRRIPNFVVEQYWDKFAALQKGEITEEERSALKNIPPSLPENSGQETPMELILLLIKMKCEKEELAQGLLFYGANIKRMKADIKFFDEKLSSGWRKTFIGEAMNHWMMNRDKLEIDFQRAECVIRIGEA